MPSQGATKIRAFVVVPVPPDAAELVIAPAVVTPDARPFVHTPKRLSAAVTVDRKTQLRFALRVFVAGAVFTPVIDPTATPRRPSPADVRTGKSIVTLPTAESCDSSVGVPLDPVMQMICPQIRPLVACEKVSVPPASLPVAVLM
jgi:hypothetical protein